jgi:hypothetical protein
MNRYATSKIIKDSNEKRYQTSLILPVLPLRNTDTYIITTSIERLDKLASTFYQDASLWWVIAAANAIGKGTVIVPPNSRIRIPDAANLQQIINDVNSTR